MSNQVHHAIWHRETYSAEGVLECLSGMPFEVEFISFDDVKKGIPEDIGVIINVGDAYTAFSGAENWIDEEVVTNIVALLTREADSSELVNRQHISIREDFPAVRCTWRRS